MYKIVGIVCILTGCVGLGNWKVRQDKERIRYLHEMIQMIQRIQGEISYGKHTLPEICQMLANENNTWYAPYLTKIYRQTMQGDGVGLKEAWEAQMRACLRSLPLQEEEKEILVKLPACFGLQEVMRQAAAFEAAVELLGRKCRQAEEAYENRAKMIHSVSVLTGLLLSILLL